MERLWAPWRMAYVEVKEPSGCIFCEKPKAGDDRQELILHRGQGRADVFLQSCTFHDRLLWSTVERDGKKIYTGAFGHWFANDLRIEPGK